MNLFTEEAIAPSVKPVFIDESAEWEDESTLNTPAKQAINTYFPDYDQTPHKPQSVSHIIHPSTQQAEKMVSDSNQSSMVPQSHGQSASSKPMTSQSVFSRSEVTQSAAGNPRISSQSQAEADRSRPHEPEPPEVQLDDDEEQDVPQSQLLQKLFPSVSVSSVQLWCAEDMLSARDQKYTSSSMQISKIMSSSIYKDVYYRLALSIALYICSIDSNIQLKSMLFWYQMRCKCDSI